MRLMVGLLAVVLVASTVPAFADIYDDFWIRQCIKDYRDQGQTMETIRIYCACMNDHMMKSEERSITQWENTHLDEMEYCASRAGWRGR